jgi:hypothetical protein
MTYTSTQFSFETKDGESIGDRVVRCCHAALDAGPMSKTERHDFYRDFIACNQEDSQQKADALATVATSCALFVRAVRTWCGAPAMGPYVPGTAMFKSMGDVSTSHPAFVKAGGSAQPNPGDYFYIASPPPSQKNDGHTGIFVALQSSGAWTTAEGGGGSDGTQCRFTERTIQGSKFTNDSRSLWGWFDCTKVGLPQGPSASDGSTTETSSTDSSTTSDATTSDSTASADAAASDSTASDAATSTDGASTDAASTDAASTDAASADEASADEASADQASTNDASADESSSSTDGSSDDEGDVPAGAPSESDDAASQEVAV